jgi:hypothetical protein
LKFKIYLGRNPEPRIKGYCVYCGQGREQGKGGDGPMEGAFWQMKIYHHTTMQ